MRVSLNTIKTYTTVDLSVPELVAKINSQLGQVENVIDLGSRYEGAIIVKVVTCENHPNADKLSVCSVDDGSGELIQVVCGAPNVRAGIFAVWLKPGMTVPSTAEDKEPFVLGTRELRGIMSNGMLAAGDELAINNDHDGIIEITERDLAAGRTLQAGMSFAEAFDLNDTLIDIENKMFTHRPDLFGQLGVAREIAGIQNIPFNDPDWYWNEPAFVDASELELVIFNDTPEKVPRLMAVAMSNVSIAPSPLWLQTTLLRWGSKSINNIVDMTNYVMLLSAQPTHAYDYDKLRGATLGARMAKPGETITLLNGKTYTLNEDDIVMADADGPIGLAGIMGGGESEVDESTTRIVIEVANFNMYAVRKSAMRHGVFTDALSRFNKGQSPLQNSRVLARLLEDVSTVSGATQASPVFDNYHVNPKILNESTSSGSMILPAAFINARLGLDLDSAKIGELLRNVHFACLSEDDGQLNITAPFWRTDIELPEDIVEEVGRLHGFDKLSRELPQRSILAVPTNPNLTLKQTVRQQLSKAGANEVLTYSFVHERLLDKTGQDKQRAYKLSNALSPDLQYYRLALMPSLLDKIQPNIKSGFNQFALFELGKVHFKGEMNADEPGVPNEDSHVACVVASKHMDPSVGAPYFHARRYLEEIIDVSNHEFVPMNGYDMSHDDWGQQLTAAYDPNRSAIITKGDQVWGIVGEFRSEVRSALKLPQFAAGFELHLDLLSEEAVKYVPLSRFPSVTQDISIRTASSVPYAMVSDVVDSVITKQPPHITVTATPSVIYQPSDGTETTTTFRLKVTSDQATLAARDVRPIVQAIEKASNERFAGQMV
ncbi:phenylalanine--tRNA ligase subunit beta [Candidatus Saccharibacteria bacterium]|nr:phenylalanine--tRNA ligase subunit beta [Candidatus Saccharibacteria bacterium]